MREKEHWQDYLIPFFWVAGLFMVMISVAVFGRLGAPHDGRIYAVWPGTTDAVWPGTTDDSVFIAVNERIVSNNPDPFAEEEGGDRLGKPASTKHVDLCAWNLKLLAKVNTVQDYSPEKVPQWIRQFTTLTESDGATYYYALGYVHDNFSRKISDDRRANFEKAALNFKRAIELDNVAYYHHFLGQTNYFYAKHAGRQEYLDTAIESYKKAASLDPTWPMPPSMQGLACLEKGNYEEAYVQFQQALEIDSQWGEARTGLERLRSLRPELFIEKPAMTIVIEAKPTSNRIAVPETRNSYELDKWVDKINVIYRQENKDFNPENAVKLLAEKTDLKETDGAFYYFALGYLHDRMSRDSQLFRKSNYARAIENFTKAIELDDSVAIFYHFRGQVNYFYALYENAPEFYEKALDNYKIAEKRDPTWPMPVCLQGWVAFRKGNDEEAITQLERALEVDTECLDALKCLIEVSVKMSENNPKDAEIIKKGLAAIKRLHTLLKEGKTFGNISYVPGWSRLLIERLKQLEPVNEETNSEFLSRLDRLSFIYEAVRNKEYVKALKKIDAFDFSEENIYYVTNVPVLQQNWTEQLAVCRTICYYETGDYENALEYIKTSSFSLSHSLSLNHPPLIEYYAEIHAKLGLYEELLEWFSRTDGSIRLGSFFDMHINYALFKTGQTEKACEMFATRWTQYDNRLMGTFVAGFRGDEEIIGKLQDAYFQAVYEKASQENAETARQPNSQTSRLNNWISRQRPKEMLSPDHYKKAGMLFERQENYRIAIPMYEICAYFEPTDESILLLLMKCQQKAEQLDNAVRTASQLIAVAPNNAEYWLARANMTHLSRNFPPRVLYDVTRAIELLEASGATKETLQRVYLQRAELLSQQEPLAALEDYMKVIEMAMPGTKLEEIRFETFEHPEGVAVFDLTLKMMQSVPRGHQKFVSICEQLLKKGGDERRLLVVRASLYSQLGQHAKAIDDYKVVVMFEPSENDTFSKSDAYARLGGCYHMTGKLDEAIENYSLALEENPRNQTAYQGRTTVYQTKSYQHGLTEEQRNKFQELARQDNETRMELLQQQRPPR